MPDAERESKGQKSEEKSGNQKGNEEGTQSQGRASLLQPEVESGAHSEDRNDTCLLSASERQSPVSLQGNGWGLPKWDGEVHSSEGIKWVLEHLHNLTKMKQRLDYRNMF